MSPTTVMEAMSRQETLQPFSKTGKPPSAVLLRSMVFPHAPCARSFSMMDKPGHTESGFNQMNAKNQRVLASPTSTSQLSTEFSDWHLWKCGQCFKTFTQRILLQMHVCTQNPDRPYQCGHCSQSFSQPSELRNHVVTHSSDRPFKCGYCGRRVRRGHNAQQPHPHTHRGEAIQVSNSASGATGASRRPPSSADTSGCPTSASPSARAANQSRWIS
ncbi:hypothetical protein SKAU_G00017440 [Synaphobranchus kaupii]|uniref:C2H2-type domain-containing protein n=1 Tax=Synaphobranchus kaupii TaxID=118154 RepID=A0A9Q1JBV4_SYNKA|nr:hypothetical protein SKAU_G00017440 [Synaphobranchus kaupii]